MVSKSACFIEHKIGYQPTKFQCFRLSVSTFTEGIGKHNYNVISYSWASRLRFFAELNVGYPSARCQMNTLGGLDQVLPREVKTP